MEHVLDQLPKRCRGIYILSRIENLSNTDIANQLGISRRSVENQITIAVRHIKLNIEHIAVMVITVGYYLSNK
ncbi:sigma factor-like helix-turn-helix DNA-binding protein [Mucilaginibacter agri]|uniref:RNA polymerase sigma factor 70 region 4 type 2 domain-containing protein n=1 Tax=Mucilaginibacter agri TaxID=2695265 RepID=A0A965ZGU6_9SPHI|nr:sigma factor-like helix-turn-helix DNA-binding protein [Mucilaginibacter agri]NCD69734.1 hypothetical protein [Mucilaginibacter agri]